jgi:23S rRNA (pseudouridine1915-N3)-methyltransferase
MLKFKIIVVDRTRSSFLKEGELFYRKRLGNYAQLEWVEVKSVRITKGRSVEEVLEAEGDALARRLNAGDYLVALDRKGDQVDSVELAGWFQKLSVEVGGWVTFVIGGPLGLSRETVTGAQKVLSLSRLTLTHEMCRLVVLEQIYRAMTILRGEKYHK